MERLLARLLPGSWCMNTVEPPSISGAFSAPVVELSSMSGTLWAPVMGLASVLDSSVLLGSSLEDGSSGLGGWFSEAELIL